MTHAVFTYSTRPHQQTLKHNFWLKAENHVHKIELNAVYVTELADITD